MFFRSCGFIVSALLLCSFAGHGYCQESELESWLRWAIEAEGTEYRLEIRRVHLTEETPPAGFKSIDRSVHIGPEGNSWEFLHFHSTELSSAKLKDFLRVVEENSSTHLWQESLQRLNQSELLSLYFGLRKASSIQPEQKSLPDLDDKIPTGVKQKRVQVTRTVTPISILSRRNLLGSHQLMRLLELDSLISWIEAHRSIDHVYYNNDLGRHLYHHEDLEQAVWLLWEKLRLLTPEKRKDLSNQLSSESWSALTQTQSGIEGETRIDLLDLLRSTVQQRVLLLFKDQEFKPQSFRVFIRGFLRNFLFLDREATELPLLATPNPKKHNSWLLLCASEKASVEWRTNSNLPTQNFTNFRATPAYLYFTEEQLLEAESATILCGSRQFRVSVKTHESDHELEFPAKINPDEFLQDKLNVFVSFSMLDTLSPQAVKAFTSYIQAAGGYTQVGEIKPIKDVRNYVIEQMIGSDIYFAAAHQLNLNRMEVAPSTAVGQLIFEKEVPHPLHPDELLKIRGKVLLPYGKKQGDPVTLSQNDLSKIFKQRRKLGRSTKVCIALSCHSEQAVEAWMTAFRMSFYDEEKMAFDFSEVDEVNDAPVVVGSRRGFQVLSPAQIMTYMGHIFAAIDTLASGRSAESMLEALNQPKRMSPLARRMVESFGYGGSVVEEGDKGFQAASNLDEESREFFSFYWRQIRVEDLATGKVYFY